MELTRVSLRAFPDENSEFVGWDGDPDCLDGEISSNSDVTCTAIFNVLPPPPDVVYNLEVLFVGGAGTISSSPSGLFCTSGCIVAFEENTQVTLFIRPDSGYSFVGWGGDADGDTFSTSVLLDGNKTVVAMLRPNN